MNRKGIIYSQKQGKQTNRKEVQTMVTVNGRTKKQQSVVNYIIDNMERVGKEKLETMYEMEYNLYLEGALNDKEHEYIRKQLRKAMRKVS